METFKIEIQEFISKVIEIEAESASEAISKVNNMYWNEEIVLDYDDFVTSEIEELKYEQFTF